MFTRKSSREWRSVAALLVVFLSGLVLPSVEVFRRELTTVVSAFSAPKAVRVNHNWSSTGSISNDDKQLFVPSEAKLDSFTAKQYPGGRVLVEWHTGLEVDNLGFNVYREVSGKRVCLTPQMLAGSALMTGERANLKSGYSYAWPDDPANVRDTRYWLEAIDLKGQATMFGPVVVGRAEARDGPAQARVRASLLSGIGKNAGQANATAPIALTAGATGIGPELMSAQSSLAARQAIKLSVNKEGWYRVTQPELVAAGLDERIDPKMLQLYAGGREQSILVKGDEDGRFDRTDAIEFYGIGLDTAATDTRVYWLAFGSEPGRRIEQVKGKGSRASASAAYTVERKDRTVYFSGLRNGDKENFFGAVIVKNPVDQAIEVRHLDKSAGGAATIDITLQGVSEAAHRVSVELNGTALGEIGFPGNLEGKASFSVPQAVLTEGQNIVRLTPAEAYSDVSLVDNIRITYPHAYSADNNSLRFTLAKKQQVTVDGFDNSAIRVFDITDPDEVRQVSSRVEQQAGGYSITVSAPKPGARTLWALADDQVSRVAAITANRPSDLREAEHRADFVIVSHRNFLESVMPLKSLRESQGLSVSIVDVEDIYDEFSYGEKSPLAIRDFLAFARTTWRTAPRFALLVGDASLDPKNYMGRGDYDFVPSRLVDTQIMETVSDGWLADFDGDGLEEMALGRLPVRTVDEASRIIDKIVSYDSSPRTRNILLVSDLNDGIDFEGTLGQVRTLVPADMNVTQIDRGVLGTTAAKSELIERLNEGVGIISYFGHGSVDQWRGDLLTSSDAVALANGELCPVVFAITCLNGYFQDPALDSLAESLINADGGGAVAVWASSGMCDAGPQAVMNQEMFRLIFSSGNELTLGEAAIRAKNSIKDSDVRLTYILFGDPTSRIKIGI